MPTAVAEEVVTDATVVKAGGDQAGVEPHHTAVATAVTNAVVHTDRAGVEPHRVARAAAAGLAELMPCTRKKNCLPTLERKCITISHLRL